MYNYNYSDGRFPDYIQNQLNRPPPSSPGRHQAILNLSYKMVGERIPDDVIFATIRAWLPDPDKKDKEILEAIKGAHARGPTPANGASKTHNTTSSHREAEEAPQSFSASGKRKALPSDNEFAEPFQVLSGLFKQAEYVCLTFPSSEGAPTIDDVRTLAEWSEQYTDSPGMFATAHGVWFMINPAKPAATTHSTESVADFRYSLIELEIPKPHRHAMTNDEVASKMEEFYSALHESNLPIAATYTSGGPSIHALVKVEADSLDEYKERVKFLYEYCSSMPGFDKQNNNASRLSRLPGAFRNGQLQMPLTGDTGAANWEDWKQHLPVNDGFPEIKSFRQLQEMNLEWPEELIEGILHKGSKMTISSSSKAKKTWIMVNLALALASGTPWLDLPTSKCKVLFVNLELQECFLKYRINKIYPEMQIEENDVGDNLDIWNLRGYCTDATILIPRLISRAKNRNYGAIFLDPTYKLMGSRDENAAGDIAALLNEFEKLAVQTGAAVICSAHYSKGNQANKESIDRTSGSGVFGRDPDTIMALTQHEEQSAVVAEFNLRNFPPMESFTVEWDSWLFRRYDLDPNRLKKKAGRTIIHTAQDLLNILADQELTSTEWLAQCKEKYISNGSFYTLLAELKKSELVHKCEWNSKWEVVQTGNY